MVLQFALDGSQPEPSGAFRPGRQYPTRVAVDVGLAVAISGAADNVVNLGLEVVLVVQILRVVLDQKRVGVTVSDPVIIDLQGRIHVLADLPRPASQHIARGTLVLSVRIPDGPPSIAFGEHAREWSSGPPFHDPRGVTFQRQERSWA